MLRRIRQPRHYIAWKLNIWNWRWAGMPSLPAHRQVDETPINRDRKGSAFIKRRMRYFAARMLSACVELDDPSAFSRTRGIRTRS